MKHFEVDVDITMSKRISVEAENEEHAKAIVNGWMKYNPYEYAHSFDAYVKHEITDVNEEESDEEQDGMAAGLAYLREQLEQDEIDEIRAQIDRSYRYHMMPSDCVTNDAKVIDLLEEYGADNNLPEGWWENEGDIDDWLLKL